MVFSDTVTIFFNEIHLVTLICILVFGSYIFYILRSLTGNYSQIIRVLCVGLYAFSALMFYEIFWNIGLLWYSSDVRYLYDALSFSFTLYILLITIPLINKMGYNLPSPNTRIFILLSIITSLSIINLANTGFYTNLLLFRENPSLQDPHNIEWAISKVVTIFGWIPMIKPPEMK